MPLNWSYGVTTVPSRRSTLLSPTLESLCRAGFDRPRLFVDDCDDHAGYAREFGLPVSVRERNPNAGHGLRVAANWHLSLLELYLRDPWAERYAVFQDDFVTIPRLREYLDWVPYPKGGRAYLNLLTFPPDGGGQNTKLYQDPPPSPDFVGWYPARRRADGGPTGFSATALVFSREAATALLSSRYFVERHTSRTRGHQAVDGGIAEALHEVGIPEYVHWPSLVRHTGHQTSRAESVFKGQYPDQTSFPGEEFDATRWIGG